MKRALVFFTSIIFLNQYTFAESGVWIKGNWAQVNTYCTQTYLCNPSTSILHSADTVVRTSDPVLKIGVCNTSGGAIDSCNSCSSAKPTEKCEVSVVKK